MNKVPITARGAGLLRDELKRLKTVDRPRVIKAIAEARAHGDLRENAEYHAAKEQQGFIEGRIREIEGKLSHAQVIDVSRVNAGGRVVFGSTVVLLDADFDEAGCFIEPPGPAFLYFADRAGADRQVGGRRSGRPHPRRRARL